jgi:hypothetical protein
MTMRPFYKAISTHKPPKIQIKNAACFVPTGCVYSKFYQIFIAPISAFAESYGGLPAGTIPQATTNPTYFRG